MIIRICLRALRGFLEKNENIKIISCVNVQNKNNKRLAEGFLLFFCLLCVCKRFALNISYTQLFHIKCCLKVFYTNFVVFATGKKKLAVFAVFSSFF